MRVPLVPEVALARPHQLRKLIPDPGFTPPPDRPDVVAPMIDDPAAPKRGFLFKPFSQKEMIDAARRVRKAEVEKGDPSEVYLDFFYERVIGADGFDGPYDHATQKELVHPSIAVATGIEIFSFATLTDDDLGK